MGKHKAATAFARAAGRLEGGGVGVRTPLHSPTAAVERAAPQSPAGGWAAHSHTTHPPRERCSMQTACLQGRSNDASRAGARRSGAHHAPYVERSAAGASPGLDTTPLVPDGRSAITLSNRRGNHRAASDAMSSLKNNCRDVSASACTSGLLVNASARGRTCSCNRSDACGARGGGQHTSHLTHGPGVREWHGPDCAS